MHPILGSAHAPTTARPLAPCPTGAAGTGDPASSLALAPWRGAAVALALLGRLARGPLARAARAVWDHHPHLHLRGRRVRRLHVRVVAGAAAGVFGLSGFSALALGVRAPAAARSAVAAPADVAHVEAEIPSESGGVSPPAPVAPGSEASGATATAGEAAAPPQEPVREAPNMLPVGKGMWFHRLEMTGETPEEMVARAQAAGLTHVYVRLGSSKGGFYAQGDLDRLLPVAHAGGIKVVGWDFPYLHDPVADAERAAAQIAYRTPDGHGIDAFSADIETGSEGVLLAADRVDLYGRTLRERVGPDEPLVGTVPNACLNESFPYTEVARWFDAIAPMVYWITRDPGADVACNMERLAPFGRPVLPIGQAYDPAIDNPGLVGLAPGYDHLARFMAEASARGASGVSFWAWHTASPEMWQAVADSPDFSLTPMAPNQAGRGPVATLQRLLNAYGYGLPVDGTYGPETTAALADLQAGLGLAPTGALDARTITALVGPTPR